MRTARVKGTAISKTDALLRHRQAGDRLFNLPKSQIGGSCKVDCEGDNVIERRLRDLRGCSSGIASHISDNRRFRSHASRLSSLLFVFQLSILQNRVSMFTVRIGHIELLRKNTD